jgi:hypothetical protein
VSKDSGRKDERPQKQEQKHGTLRLTTTIQIEQYNLHKHFIDPHNQKFPRLLNYSLEGYTIFSKTLHETKGHNTMKRILFVFAFLIQPAVAAQWLVKEMLIPPSGVVADPDGILSDAQKEQLLDKLQPLDMTLRAVDDDNKESKEAPIQLAVAVIEKVGTVLVAFHGSLLYSSQVVIAFIEACLPTQVVFYYYPR